MMSLNHKVKSCEPQLFSQIRCFVRDSLEESLWRFFFIGVKRELLISVTRALRRTR